VTTARLDRVGLNGRFKVGQWTPLTVSVEAKLACKVELQVETSDPEGNRAVWTDDFDVPAAGTHRLAMLIQAGRLETTLRPRLVVRPISGDQQWTVPVAAGESDVSRLTQKALTHTVLWWARWETPAD
jgi:hypothetical protein